MTLELVSKEIEELENDLNFYQNRLESLKSLIYPGATDYKKEIVDGGKRIDKIYKYVEVENQQQLEVTIMYIKAKIKDLNDWKDKEIERLSKYGESVRLVVFLKEKEFKTDYNGRKRHLYWDEIARIAHCSEKSARNWYKIGIKKRKSS